MLVLLIIVILASRYFSAWVLRHSSAQNIQSVQDASEDRDKALAAIIAVTALVGGHGRGEGIGAHGDES